MSSNVRLPAVASHSERVPSSSPISSIITLGTSQPQNRKVPYGCVTSCTLINEHTVCTMPGGGVSMVGAMNWKGNRIHNSLKTTHKIHGHLHSLAVTICNQ